MADLMSLLRQCHLNKKKIIERDDQIILGEFSWPKNAKTNYLIYGSGKDGSEKKYYTLECLLFFLKNEHLKHAMYVRQAARENIQIVRRPDRQNLLDYLKGKTQTTDAHDKVALSKIPLQIKRAAEDHLVSKFSKKPCFENAYIQKAKQQLAAKLDAPKEVCVLVDEIKSLSETMTVDKIAAIKAKRLAKKRASIKENYDPAMETDLQPILDMDVEETNIIISREKQYTNRTTILQRRQTIFADKVFEICDRIEEKERRNVIPPPPMVAPRSTEPKPTAYSRYAQERFTRRIEQAGEFNIDTGRTYHGMTLELVKEASNTASYKSITKSTPLLPVSAAKFTPQEAAQNKRSSRTPIIIVPPSINTSLITMHNAKDILEDLRFISTEQKRNQGIKREKEFIIQRHKEGRTSAYRVVDNPLKLTKEEWDRVVAVFAIGPQWQFKDWPFNGPVEIFSKICAFHVKYDEMLLDANIARWAVSVIEISKTKRHLDRAAIMKFWEVLDNYLTQQKAYFRI